MLNWILCSMVTIQYFFPSSILLSNMNESLTQSLPSLSHNLKNVLLLLLLLILLFNLQVHLYI